MPAPSPPLPTFDPAAVCLRLLSFLHRCRPEIAARTGPPPDAIGEPAWRWLLAVTEALAGDARLFPVAHVTDVVLAHARLREESPHVLALGRDAVVAYSSLSKALAVWSDAVHAAVRAHLDARAERMGADLRAVGDGVCQLAGDTVGATNLVLRSLRDVADQVDQLGHLDASDPRTPHRPADGLRNRVLSVLFDSGLAPDVVATLLVEGYTELTARRRDAVRRTLKKQYATVSKPRARSSRSGVRSR